MIHHLPATVRHNPVFAVLAGFWVLLGLFVALHQPGLVSATSVTSILQFATILALVSLGQALVIVAGGAGIDLSLGGNVSLSAILGMLAIGAGAPGPALPVLCLAAGAVLGLVNGLLVTRLKIFPLIITLGTFYVYSGLALALTGGAALPGVPDWALPWGRGTLSVLPLPFLTLVVPAFLLAAVILWFSAWGRWIYAMGYNEPAARLVGIPVDPMRIALYTLAGLLAGAAAFVSLAWFGSGRPNMGVNLELESLTAALLGGVAIFGGRGGVLGVLSAVLLLVALKTSMLQLGISPVWQVGAVGLLLILVVLVDRFWTRRS